MKEIRIKNTEKVRLGIKKEDGTISYVNSYFDPSQYAFDVPEYDSYNYESYKRVDDIVASNPNAFADFEEKFFSLTKEYDENNYQHNYLLVASSFIDIRENRVLKYVPEKNRDKKLCLTAVRSNPYDLFYVPEHIIDYEICMEAVKNCGRVLSNVPKHLIDYDLCREAVIEDGESFRSVPKYFITYEICLIAIRTCPRLITEIPVEYIDERLFSRALSTEQHKGLTIQYVEKHAPIVYARVMCQG